MIEDLLKRLLQAAYKPESAPPGFKEDNLKRLLQDEVVKLRETGPTYAEIRRRFGISSEEYHKGEMCPYTQRTGRASLLCQEGFCCRCQIWYDLSRMKGVSAPNCPLGLEVCYGSCYWWMDGKCTFLLEGLNGLSQNGDAR